MKGVVVGGSVYTKQDGKKRANISVKCLRVPENWIGEQYKNYNCAASVLPSENIKDLIGKTFIIDGEGGFANEFQSVNK